MSAFLDLRISLQRFLLDFSMKNLSAGVGTSFPTTNLTQNMIFYRSDQDKIYRLNVVNPASWVVEVSDYFYFDFDAHALQPNYPERDLIGIRGYGLRSDDGMLQIEAMVGLSIFNDSKLIRHNKIMDKLFQVLLPSKIIPVQNYSDGSGTKYEDMKVMNGTEVLPTVNTDARVFQFVGVMAGTGVTAE